MRPDQLPQSALDPAGSQAAQIFSLWQVSLALCVFVFLAVLGALGWALWRARRRPPAADPDLSVLGAAERKPVHAVIGAVALSAAGLAFLIIASYTTDRAMAQTAAPQLTIEVTAHQWWWEARYRDADPSKTF